jgi:hypothetical protein
MIDDSSTLPVPVAPGRVSPIARPADIPEEDYVALKAEECLHPPGSPAPLPDNGSRFGFRMS